MERWHHTTINEIEFIRGLGSHNNRVYHRKKKNRATLLEKYIEAFDKREHPRGLDKKKCLDFAKHQLLIEKGEHLNVVR